MPKATTIPDIDIFASIKEEWVWKTILFNCNCHTFNDVIDQLVYAIGCSEATASQMAHVVHNFGSIVAYKGEKESCERVADILGKIGLLVKVTN
jgi:hypothetical protein